jgi:sporulation protein YlmC with PRC-barrel domain
MQTLLQFQRNARVLDSNARPIGSLERVVLDSKTREVTHVVVRKGFLLNKDEKVVPIGLVVEAMDDQVLLSSATGDLEKLTPFEEEHIVDEAGKAWDASTPPTQPLFLTGSAYGGVLSSPQPVDHFVTETVQNIPEGTVAMKEGAKVITAEGKSIGNVERVLADPLVDRVTHLIVSAGRFGRESKMIPVDLVTKIDEDEVRLRVEKESLDKLPSSTSWK